MLLKLLRLLRLIFFLPAAVVLFCGIDDDVFDGMMILLLFDDDDDFAGWMVAVCVVLELSLLFMELFVEVVLIVKVLAVV